MQKHTISNVPIVTSKLGLPLNCSGISTVGFDKIFWFPNDDMTELDIAAISSVIVSHKYGRVAIRLGVAANTYVVTIITTQDTVTPIINGVELELMDVVDDSVIFEVEATEDFTVSSLLLDMEEVTYYVS